MMNDECCVKMTEKIIKENVENISDSQNKNRNKTNMAINVGAKLKL